MAGEGSVWAGSEPIVACRLGRRDLPKSGRRASSGISASPLSIGGEGAIGIAGHRVEPIEADHCRGPTIASGGDGRQAAEASCRNREAHQPGAGDLADRGAEPPEVVAAADRNPRQSYFLTLAHRSLRSHNVDDAKQTGVIAGLFRPLAAQAEEAPSAP
jgi:hypothetical protein